MLSRPRSKFDYAPSDFNIKNVVHFSGGYELPVGKGKKFMNEGGIANAVLGGWSSNWIVTLQGGQPLNFGCHTGTTSGLGCNDVLLPAKSETWNQGHNIGRIPRPSGSETRPPSASLASWVGRAFRRSLRSRLLSKLRSADGCGRFGQQAGADRWSGIPPFRLLTV